MVDAIARQKLVDEALECYETILCRAITMVKDDWVALELTMAQLKTLVVLKSEESATVGHIADMLGVGVPTSSHLINRLVQSNLARRLEDPVDRRRIEVSLTPEGEELIRKLQQGESSLLHTWMMQMEETDLVALAQGLRALVTVLQEETT